MISARTTRDVKAAHGFGQNLVEGLGLGGLLLGRVTRWAIVPDRSGQAARRDRRQARHIGIETGELVWRPDVCGQLR